ncbi:MAG: hypothetical protein HXX20_11030, partial [Chloroflexi bacterium]|nr:hypothetical protein [Chloroflexota bacterium]
MAGRNNFTTEDEERDGEVEPVRGGGPGGGGPNRGGPGGGGPNRGGPGGGGPNRGGP